MRLEDCYQLGNITKPHGLKGELNIYIDADAPSAYQELESVFVEIHQKLVPFFVESLGLKGNRGIIAFEDVLTYEQAEAMRGCALYLPLTMLPVLQADQFYYHEIIGYKVVDAKEGELGLIKAVYASGRQDLLEMTYQGQEILIPISDEIVSSVDRPGQLLHVQLPEGLLDVYLNS